MAAFTSFSWSNLTSRADLPGCVRQRNVPPPHKYQNKNMTSRRVCVRNPVRSGKYFFAETCDLYRTTCLLNKSKLQRIMYYSTFPRFLSPPCSPHLLSHHSRTLSQKELRPGVPLRALLPPPHYGTCHHFYREKNSSCLPSSTRVKVVRH